LHLLSALYVKPNYEKAFIDRSVVAGDAPEGILGRQRWTMEFGKPYRLVDTDPGVDDALLCDSFPYFHCPERMEWVEELVGVWTRVCA
jgi:hypothetical protein